MKNFEISNVTYTITAVAAVSQFDTERQDALLVVADDGTETTQHVVFGWAMPETAEDLAEMFDDTGAWEAVGNLYFPDEDWADCFFGSQHPICVTASEVDRLASEWECDDLWDHMHEASDGEIAEFGIAIA